MNIRKLNIFYETAKCLNMSKVAKELHISQPNISKNISELEAEVNIKLFDRIGKRLYLTHEGEIFFQYVRRILNLYDEAIIEINSFSKDNIGKIVVGATSTIGTYVMPYIIKKFNEIAENIEVEIVIDNMNTIEYLVLHNKVDIALIEGNIISDELFVKEIWKDELVFISGNNYKWKNKKYITKEELENTKLIIKEKSSGARQTFDLFVNNEEIIYKNFIELSNTEAIINYVKLNMGVGCVPYIAVKQKEKLEGIKIHKFVDKKIERSLNMVIHMDKHISKIMSYFIRFCEEFDM